MTQITRARLGQDTDKVTARAQRRANRTNEPVEVQYQRKSTEGRGDRNYWAYLTTVYPQRKTLENVA